MAMKAIMTMRPAFFILSWLLFSTHSLAQPTDKAEAPLFDFDKLAWGMSQEEFDRLYSDQERCCSDRVMILNYQAWKGYEFVLKQLVYKQFSIIPPEQLVEPIRLYKWRLNAFYELQQYLDGLYGAVVADKQIWRAENPNRAKPNAWGYEIYKGNLELRSVWKHRDTVVLLVLRGEQDKTSGGLWLYYSSKLYSEIAKRFPAEVASCGIINTWLLDEIDAN